MKLISLIVNTFPEIITFTSYSPGRGRGLDAEKVRKIDSFLSLCGRGLEQIQRVPTGKFE